MASTETLYFAHSNGFPSASYRKLFAALEDGFRIEALPMAGHRPDLPVDDNWRNLVRELIEDLESKAERPVIGVGHSMGGILTLLAASERPELFKAFVMLDPPIVMGSSALLTALAKRGGLMDRITPAAQSIRRRTEWPDVDAAVASLRGKALFRNFDPDCLRDYLQFGTAPQPQGGVRLRYDPKVEATVFRTIPHNLPRLKPVRVPGALVYGDASGVARPRDIRQLGKRQQLLVRPAPGGHMFPLEQPQATAEVLQQVIAQLTTSRAATA